MQRTLLTSLLLILVISVSLAKTDTTTPKKDYLCVCSNVKGRLLKSLIADETYLTYTKTGAIITTPNESIFRDISLKWGTDIQKIDISHTQENGHWTKQYTITISEKTAQRIKHWAIKHL